MMSRFLGGVRKSYFRFHIRETIYLFLLNLFFRCHFIPHQISFVFASDIRSEIFIFLGPVFLHLCPLRHICFCKHRHTFILSSEFMQVSSMYIKGQLVIRLFLEDAEQLFIHHQVSSEICAVSSAQTNHWNPTRSIFLLIDISPCIQIRRLYSIQFSVFIRRKNRKKKIIIIERSINSFFLTTNSRTIGKQFSVYSLRYVFEQYTFRKFRRYDWDSILN